MALSREWATMGDQGVIRARVGCTGVDVEAHSRAKMRTRVPLQVSHAHDRSLFHTSKQSIIIVRYHKSNGYGQVAWAQALLVDYHNFLNWRYVYHESAKQRLCSLRLHNASRLLRVTVLIVWNGNFKSGLCDWPCDHLASCGIMMEPTTVAWNCSQGVKQQLIAPYHHILPN